MTTWGAGGRGGGGDRGEQRGGGGGGGYDGQGSQKDSPVSTRDSETSQAKSYKTSSSYADVFHSVGFFQNWKRGQECAIPGTLVDEALRDGLMTDQRDSTRLHFSDHVIVVSSADHAGNTAYRNELHGPWWAERSTEGPASLLDTAYFFSQVIQSRLLQFARPLTNGLLYSGWRALLFGRYRSERGGGGGAGLRQANTWKIA